MQTLSPTLEAPRPDAGAPAFRSTVQREDIAYVESLVRATGVFNANEIAIARDLVEEAIGRGEAAGYKFLFADGPEGLQGYVCFGPIPGTAKRFELYWIAVHPLARRLHLGKRLQEAAEATVRGLGGVYMMAETSTRTDYAAARNFYAALGYRLLAEVPDWHDEGDGLAIFGKRL